MIGMLAEKPVTSWAIHSSDSACHISVILCHLICVISFVSYDQSYQCQLRPVQFWESQEWRRLHLAPQKVLQGSAMVLIIYDRHESNFVRVAWFINDDLIWCNDLSGEDVRFYNCEILLWGHLLRTPYLVQQKYGAITQKLEMSLARNKI